MRKKIRLGILLLMAVALSSATAVGQILENYRFETGTTNTWYSADTELIAAGKDDAVSAVTDIGFTFYYDGVEYTQFSVNSNGILRLGSTLVGTNYNNHFGSNLSVNNPKIVGVGRDMSTGAAGYVKTGSVGTQNNLIRVVEYLLNTSSSSSGTNYFQFQIQLYQGSNEIRIVYGTNSDYQSVPSSYQIGLVNADGNKIWVVSPNLHVADYATSAVSDSYSVHPGSGRFYSFAPDPLKTIGAAANLPYTCNFENTTENGNWAFGNAVDGWAIGSATNNGGSNSLYVSNDGGTTNAYNSGAQYIYAIRALNIQATGSYKVSYNWKCQGENNCDYLRSFLVPASLSPDLVGRSQQYINSITTSSCPGGWIAIDGGANLGRQTEWQTKALTVSLSSTGTYYLVFYWRSDGSVQGGNNNPPAAVDNVSVKYLPVAASLPYTCNFETDSENTKWILANGSQANYWMIGNSTYSSSSKSLYITNDGSSNAYTIKLTTTPNAASSVYAYRNLTFASAGNYVVSFKWKGFGESTYDYLRAFLVPNSVETLEAGNMNSIGTAGSPTNWIAVDGDTKLNLQSSWQVNSQTVNVPTAGEYNLVFYWRNDNSGGTQPPIAIDDIEVAQPCTATAGIAVNVQGPTSAVITRTSGDADAYQLLVSSNSNPYAATETPVAMTSSSMTLSELAEHTTYYAFIRCRCSEYRYGEWSNAVNFTTPYTPATVPYTCDFEDATVNSKWILANMVGGNYWMIGNAPSDGSSNSLYITNDGSSYTYTISSALSYVYAYRNLSFATAGDYVVSFKWKGFGENNYDYLRAFLVPISVQTLTGGNANGIVATGAPSGWIAVDGGSKLNLKSDWQVNSQTVNIQTAGEYNLVFFWRNDGTSGTQPPAAVDDIEVSTPCTASATITVGEVEFTSAVITRTSGSSSKYEVLISTSSDPVAATETPFELTSASQTINELTPGTQYYAYIRGYCSEYRPGPWSSAVSFETESAFTLPYHQDFEGGTAYGWTMANATNGWYVGTATAKDGEYSLYVSNNGGGVNEYSPDSYSYSYAYCKLLVEETGVFNVSFDWKCNGYNNFHLLRAFLIPARLNPNLNSGQPNGMANNSNNAPAEWIAIDGGKLNFSRDWTHLSNDLILSETGEYYLVFYWRNDLYSVLYNPPAAVDNISVEFSTACLPVTNLVTTNVGKTSASVTWTPVGDETQWQVSLTSSQSTSPDDGNITLVNTTSHTFTGLNYDTYYYAYARAYCSESDQSPWTPVCTFLTEEACAKISDLTKSDITPTSVTLSWTSTDADASQCEVVVNQSSDPTVDVVATMVVDNTTATITGLTPGYNYNVHVRCNCGEHGYSDWYNGSFGTLDEDIPLPYSEDFESGLPSQWIITESDDNKWYVGRGANNGGVRSLYISNNNGASNNYDIQSSGMSCAYFIFEVEERCVLNVSYDWKCVGEDSYDFARAFVVPSSLEPAFYLYNGVSAYSAPSGWIPVDEGQMSGSSSWNHTSENVALEPGYYYLAFYWLNDGSVGTQPPAAIDNLSVSVVTNCMYSGNVDISNIGKTTAQASWSSSSEVSQFEVLVTTASNPDEATETPILLSSTNYEISGLDTETEYYVYVRGVCSESSKGVWYGNSFTTLPSCLPVENLTVSDYGKTWANLSWTNVEETASQWQALLTTASEPADATEPIVIVDNESPTIDNLDYETTYNVYVRSYCSDSDQSTWTYGGSFTTMLPCYPVENVTVDSYDKTWVTASWTNTDSDASQWQVMVSTATNATNATEDPVLVSTNSATIEDLEMNTTYYVYVRAYCSETAQSEWVRSSCFKTYPPCVKVTNIHARVLNSTSADIVWEDPYNTNFGHFHISSTEKTEEELDALSVPNIVSYNTPHYEVSSLIPGQTYHVYVSSYCNDNTHNTYSDWEHFSFTTPADEVMTLPYYQDFEAQTLENWHLNNNYNAWLVGDAVSSSGEKSMYITMGGAGNNAYYNTSLSYSYAYCRLFIDQPLVANVSFDWRCKGQTSYDLLRAFMIPASVSPTLTAGTDNGMSGSANSTPTNWIDVSQNLGPMSDQSSWTSSSKDVALTEPGEYYLVFFWKNNASSGSNPPAAVDNLSVEVVTTCVYPQHLTITETGKTSLGASWTQNSDATQWEVLVTTANSLDEATETPIVVNTTSALVEGLEPNTMYKVYVRAVCSESNYSAWTGPVWRKTLPPCESVYDVNARVTPTAAEINWKHPYDITDYLLVFSESEMTPAELAAASPQTQRTRTLTIGDLTPGHTYHQYIAVDCGDNETSEWYDFVFTTPELEAMPLPYYENFEDGVVQNWTVSNQINGWYLGSAVANESEMSMYISPDDGVTYQYGAYYSVSYAYCRLNIDHPSIINVSYDWTGEGYGVGANMRTFLIPVDLNPNLTAGTLNGVTSVASSVNTPSGWIELGTPYPVQCSFFNSGAASGWLRSTKDVMLGNAGEYYLVYFWGNNSNLDPLPSAAVDNISVTYVSDCVFSEDLSVDNITRTSADISWTTTGPADQWQVIVSMSNNLADATASETPVIVSNNTFTATGLEENTTYYIYIRSYCSESDQSLWVAGPSFTTYPPCEPPTDVLATLNEGEANFSWSQPYEYNNFNMYVSTTEMTAEELAAVSASYINTSDLYYYGYTDVVAGYDYHFYISSGCANEETSEWADLAFQFPANGLVELPYSQNFDGNVIENWNSVGGTNYWIVGTGVANSGSRSLYITNDDINNTYNIESTSNSFSYIKFYVEGRTGLNVSFDWRAYAEGEYDYLRVFVVPASINPDMTNSNNIGYEVVPDGWISLCSGLSNSYSWDNYSQEVIVPEAGMYYLVFYWRNDSSAGQDPPAAVDNVVIDVLSDENDILSFSFEGAENIQINSEDHTVTCEVPYTWDLTSVTPLLGISPLASVAPASGTAVNLSSPFVYTVTAESGLAQEWTVTVSRQAALANAEILSFNTEGMLSVDINSESATVNATISNVYDIAALAPVIEISYMATMSYVNGNVYDFTNPVEITVFAEDGSQKLWTVNVAYADSPLGADCTNPYVVDAETDLPYTHSSSTADMYNIYNTYFSDSNSSTMVMAGNDVTYRVDVQNRSTLQISVTSSGTYGMFVMNACGTLASYKVYSASNATGETSATIDMQPGSYYIIVDTYDDADIDYELQITRLPFCYPVSNIEIERLQSELIVTWTSDNVGDNWTLKYGLSGFDVETEGTEVEVDANTYTIEGLEESTTYDVYVKANCAGSDGASEWVMQSASTISYCQTPEDLVVAALSDYDASLSWEGFNMSQWVVEYKTAGETDYTSMSVSEPSCTISNLQSSTTYNIRVRSVCEGDTYSDYATVDFTTLCLVIRNFPYEENFDSGEFPPLCWTQERTAAGSGAGLNYINGAWTGSSSSVGDNATAKAMLADTKAGSAHNLVTNSMLFAESINGYDISIDVYRSSSSVASSAEGVEVWVNTSPDIVNGNPVMLGYVSKNYLTATDANVQAEQAPGWYTYSFNLPNRSGLNYVILVGKANNAGGVYVDNLVVSKAVDCIAPGNLAVDTYDDESVLLSWTDVNAITGTWTVRYSVNGADMVETSVSETSLTVDGLQSATAYNFTVEIQGVCAEGMESELYSDAVEFTTDCSSVDLPYTQNFAVDDGSLPECWKSVGNGSQPWSVSASAAQSVSSGSYGSSHLLSPEFVLTSGHKYLLEFDVKLSSFNVSRPDSLYVNLIGTRSNQVDVIPLQNASSNGMLRKSYTIISQETEGRLDFVHNGYRECVIDSVFFREYGYGMDILSFEVEGQTSVVIDTAAATVDVTVVYGTDVTAMNPIVTISPYATIGMGGSGVDFSNPYTTYVTAEDSRYYKDWTITVSVDENTCPNPAVDDIVMTPASDSVVISIAQVHNETAYNLKVSTLPIDPAVDSADVFNGLVESVSVINGLLADTYYYIYVQSDCDAIGWTESGFTTVCASLQLPYVQDFAETSLPSCWEIMDANADGKTWSLVDGEMQYSYSRLETADDYLTSPTISIVRNTKLKFDYRVGSFSYPETFSVYVITAGDTLRLDSLRVSNETAQTYGPVDLTDYAGQDARIAIRCQSEPYMYRLYVDNFEMSVSDYVVEAMAVGNGSITPNGNIEVAPGDSIEFTLLPDENNELISLTLDGEDVTSEVLDGVYTLREVDDEHVVVATFTSRHYIVASSSEGGHIEPEGEFFVEDSASQMFIFVPDEGYRVGELLVDGVAEEVVHENYYYYNLENITADHELYASFDPIIYHTITIADSENGSVTPNGQVTVEEGMGLVITVVPNEGYMLSEFMVDGTDAIDYVVNGQYAFENITADHTVEAVFIETIYYTITATAGNGGTITPEGESQVVVGGIISYEVVADEGYHLVSVTVDGDDVTENLVNGVYVFENVEADHEISAEFAINTYTVFAYAHGGTVSPNGTITVEYGQSQTFEFIPNDEYGLSNVFVDNRVVQVEGDSYTFENITSNHTIVVVFSPLNLTKYTIVSQASEHGSISPSGNVRVVEGDDQQFTIEPDEHYYIASVVVDGDSVDLVDEYTFVNVTSDHTISATFDIYKHVIVASAGEHGSISPAGEVMVDEGSDATFEFEPEEGYWVANVVVDGDTIFTHENDYTIENVLTDREIVVNFEPLPQWTITAIAETNGTISPEGIQYVMHGQSIEFTFLPDDGYMVGRVVVDGATVAVDGNTYTFENVTGNHYIFVSFRTFAYFITTIVGEHGQVSPSGVVEVEPGESQTFNFIPDVGYMVDSVHVDGMNVMFSGNSYTFNSVTENHVLEVSFTHINVDVEELASQQFALYPNPNDGQFSVSFSGFSGEITYMLVDAKGAVVDTRDLNVADGDVVDFVYHLIPGVYFARFINGENVVVERFVVE